MGRATATMGCGASSQPIEEQKVVAQHKPDKKERKKKKKKKKKLKDSDLSEWMSDWSDLEDAREEQEQQQQQQDEQQEIIREMQQEQIEQQQQEQQEQQQQQQQVAQDEADTGDSHDVAAYGTGNGILFDASLPGQSRDTKAVCTKAVCGPPLRTWAVVPEEPLEPPVPMTHARELGVLRGSEDICSACSVTIVTQLSIDRLHRLRAMCSTWAGPISAAVYVDSTMDCESLKQQLTEFHQEVDAAASCRLDISLVHAAESAESSYDQMYPINALRNAAMGQASTALVFLLDVDFVPAPDLCERLQSCQELHGLARGNLVSAHCVFVVPAFEVVCGAATPHTQQQLAQLCSDGACEPFHVSNFPKGHQPTDSARWMKAKHAYTVDYRNCYEPYLVMSRIRCPRYDERFRGYGMNKISHIFEVAQAAPRFVVLPEVFVTAHEHKKSEAWEQGFGGKGERRQHQKRITGLFTMFKEGTKKRYAKLSGAHSPRCQPSWNTVPLVF